MLVVTQYVTDIGFIIPYLRMDIAFVGNDLRSLQQVRDLSLVFGIIPHSLAALLQQFRSPCKSSVQPRFVILTLQNGERLKLSYPFRPDTPDWYTFWQEISTNPLIISSRGVGETLPNSLLSRL